MLQLKYPGVYTVELSSGVHSISGAPTSVALFVGPTLSGIDNRAIRIQNFGDFERRFGGLSQKSSLSYSVLHFFANGGGEAFVTRVRSAGALRAESAIHRDASGSNKTLTVTALSSGTAGNQIHVEFDAFGIDAHPFSSAAPVHDKTKFTMTVIDRLTGRVERFANLSTSSTSARFASTVVNDPATGSQLVSIKVESIGNEGPQMTGTVCKLRTLPLGGNAAFSTNIRAKLSVMVRDSAGATSELIPPGASPAGLGDITVYANGTTKPTSPLEFASQLAAAINVAIRAHPATNTAMEGVGIEVAPFEGGSFLRLRIAMPDGSTQLSRRLVDATVTLADPTAGDSVLTTFFNPTTVQVSNPSRYQLGASYASSEIVGTPIVGTDGTSAVGQPDSTEFKTAITDLDNRDPFFNLLCLPDLVRPSASDPMALHHTGVEAAYAEAARICGNKHAFLLVDPFPNVISVGAAEAWKSLKLGLQSSHAAAYFPNLRVDDPLEPGAIRAHPPSGAVAGVIARTDGQYGVWEAPAGTEAVFNGVYGPSVELSDADHGVLNPLGLNCIRQFPIFNTVVFGSRTVDGANATASEWKYVPVRRTASYILRSLQEGLRWAVHKPNGEQLWSQLRVNTTSFMQGLFRQGAFKGVSAKEAYFVACDASTTTADDMNQGVVNIVIGFAPLKPAEFVVISLRQIVQASV